LTLIYPQLIEEDEEVFFALTELIEEDEEVFFSLTVIYLRT
jgi:hypothetical protein